MVSTKLYKNSRTYDFFLKVLGYENGIARFLQRLHVDCEPDCRVLDAGCGTGLLGLYFLDRFPGATLLATDIEPNFLRKTLANADKRGIGDERVSVGVANISTPRRLTSLDGASSALEDSSFDLICVGAVVGYADDTEASIRQLLGLLAPGGYMINIEMSESPTGRLVSKRYQYRNITLSRMQEVIREEGCEVNATRFNLSHLPAKLTRTAIVARKPVV
jgi:SAM-dependent methyltransferase